MVKSSLAHELPLWGKVGIVEAAYCLPGPAIDVVDWAAGEGVAPRLVKELLENGCRYFHDGTDRSDVQLISDAVEQLVARGLDPREVGYVVHAHTEAFSMPAPPSSVLSELSARFGWRTRLEFSVSHLACASVVHALRWAAELLASDPHARHALVVTADRVFGNAKHRIRQNAGIQSDGGSAILLGRESLRCALQAVTAKNFAQLHDGPSTPQNAAAIGKYTWLHTKQLLAQLSEDAGLPLERCAAILPINADRHYWVSIARSLGLPESAFFLDNIRLRGHACCTDLAVNLVDRGFALVDEGRPVVYCGQSNVGAYAAVALAPVAVTQGREVRTAEPQAAEEVA